MEFDIFETLKEAFGSSTLANNSFADALNRLPWDEIFFADDEYYFCKGGFCFTTPSLDPFDVTRYRMPSAMFTDGSYIEF